MASGEVFEKVGGVWTKRATLSAATTGQAEAWHSGAGAPTAAIGADGDWYLDTTPGPSWPQVVSSLPGSPADGQEVYYLADGTNGIIWHLRYRAAASGSYKWEFLGGSDLVHMVDASEATGTANTWVNLATNGPLITLPLAGDYDIDVSARALADTATQHCYIGLAYGDTSPFAQFISYINASGYVMLGSPRRITGASAAAVLKERYYANTTGLQFAVRILKVRPVRVG